MKAQGRQAQNQAAKAAQSNVESQGAQQKTAGPLSGLAIGQNGVVSALMKTGNVSPSQLRSMPVYGEHGKRMGDFDQVMIDPRNGHVAYILLKRGGFLGLNPTWFAVPPEALVWSRGTPDNGYGYGVGYGYRLVVNAHQLNGVPPVPVNKANLTDTVLQQQLARLHWHFDIAPYWTGQGQAAGHNGKSPSTTGQSASESTH
jgi:sporulation protein YlmC with PRC-barrel domain